MATLVLTVVGGAIGGPIGAMLGASVGGAIDRATLFKPRRREGPRLTDLAVQTSTYGAPISQLFGTMRVAGSVIWATDLIEHSSVDGGGKGGPETVRYTYTASFAVLLSARPILGVRRIWADGKLLRGAAGDWKVTTGFRLHTGSETQVADPLIAAAEGLALAPAHRGCAYAVFENLALAEFGNRIPSLTFEVEADPGAVSCGTIVEAISRGRVSGNGADTLLGGFAAHGDALRGVIDGLAEASGSWLATDGAGLALVGADGPHVTVADRGAGSRRAGQRGVRAIATADSAPASIAIAHYDPARDYQTGLQRAVRPGAGRRRVQIDLAAALDAGAAKTLAVAALARAEVARERRTVMLDWRALAIPPGARIALAGEPGRWRVAGWTFEQMVLSLDLARVARSSVAVAADPGRPVAAPDTVMGETIVHAFEIPPLDDAVLSAPRLTIAAAGTGAGWRRAALQISLDGGAHWIGVGNSAAPAMLGTVAVAPGDGASTLVDRVNSVEVLLAAEFMTLTDADDASLSTGANIAIVGHELLQFGRVTRIGATRWRLSELWRGRRGSEWAIGTASAGDRFVLLDRAALTTVDLPATAIGGIASVMAVSAGDGDDPPQVSAAITGASVLPPSPVHLRTAVAPDGDVALDWVRRSRAGWRWIDGVDAPLCEESEAYDVAARSGEDVTLSLPAAVPQAELPSSVRSHGSPGVAVRQRGLFGLSRPVTRALPPL